MVEKPAKLKIRSYKNNDYVSVRSILAETGLLHENIETKTRLENKIRRDPKSILVAELNGQVVGNVILIEDGWNAFIFRLAVKKDQQGKGIGSKILDRAEKVLKSKGAKQIVLMVRNDKEELKEFYMKRGYHTSNTVTHKIFHKLVRK